MDLSGAPGDAVSFRASTQSGEYPRPQLVRQQWRSLCGEWSFDHDDADAGLDLKWFSTEHLLSRTITVPFPPESALSGIADTRYHPIIWYRRTMTREDIRSSGRTCTDDRVFLHFGAVDYYATVWINGHLVGTHEGGQTPFSFDITGHVAEGTDFTLVVRAQDDPHDVSQPRGKQDWQEEPHSIWYHRTSGIWQTVWLESVPAISISALTWEPNVPSGSAQLDLKMFQRTRETVTVRVDLSIAGHHLSTHQVSTAEPRVRLTCDLANQANGQAYQSLLWSPEHPRLIDARVSLLNAAGDVLDEVWSYLGLRSTRAERGHFLLNDRPYYIRSVLEQGYWPESFLAAPDAKALQTEVQLIKDLGFNAARLHEKVEDPRFLYWADRLGLLIWAEMGSAFEFSATSVERVTREWLSVIERDRSHPCIVTWVPLNESWGVQHVAHNRAQLHFVQALYHLTKALDGSRPVISNDGWEHAESDLLTIHDYASTGEALISHYEDAQSIQTMVDGLGPAGRRLILLPAGEQQNQTVIVSEFGGVTYAPDSPIKTWGYSTVESAEDYAHRLRELFSALHQSPVLAGFCYTQLTDTLQEANGLTDENRIPKLPIAEIREIVMGHNHQGKSV
ncbi:glycoside hydrolase family 2 protein [Cryobacterium lyxosi]|uniref:Glycoside hydrolase n=1 Tax=Cryobacterium lyxosi TaxID=1259228 RepID=A0A4R8ZAI0_9MICO|nr:sugar-binding domain-containing protein [Cryobacterium lyxosi]TFD23161.1 glycoside hydrolase [Cryobacterium lyxosi]